MSAKPTPKEIIDFALKNSENKYCQCYANAAMGMIGEQLEVQIQYILSNLEPNLKDKLIGPRSDHCHICGVRGEAMNKSPNGKVCQGCYDAEGDPNKCSKCGYITYEGDTLYTTGFVLYKDDGGEKKHPDQSEPKPTIERYMDVGETVPDEKNRGFWIIEDMGEEWVCEGCLGKM